MTPLQERLSEMRKIADAATEGPWIDWYGALCIDVDHKTYFKLVGPNMNQGPPFVLPKRKENMDFIVESRTMMPRMIEAVEYLYKTVNNLEEILDDEELKLEADEWREEIERILKGE